MNATALAYVRTADAILRQVAGEHLLVPIRSGHLVDAETLYILDDVGATVWEALSQPSTLESLTRAVHDEFEVAPGQDVAADLQSLLADLVAQGLVREEPAA